MRSLDDRTTRPSDATSFPASSFDSVSPFIVKGNPVIGVGTYVFESLLGRNWGEPFSLYGLLAESIDVSDDRQTVTFKIRPEARFSDGSPVTAEDVKFSLETLRDKGRPRYKNIYSQITAVELPDARTVVSPRNSDPIRKASTPPAAAHSLA